MGWPYLAGGKELLGEADAAHLATGEGQGGEAFADDEFGTATAYVHHQHPTFQVLGVGHPLIDEARLLLAADHLYGVAEQLCRPGDELPGIAGPAQGIGAGDADLIRLDVGEPLGEQGKAVEAPLHGLRGHAALLIHPFGEAHPLLDPVDDLHAPFGEASDHHMKAVGAEIDGGVEASVHEGLTRCV